MLVHKGIPEDISPGTGRSSYAKRRRARRIGSDCHKYARQTCNGNCRSIGLASINRDDKIQFFKDGLSKENLDDIQLSLETHPSRICARSNSQIMAAILNERQHLGNLTLKDPVCQFIRKLDGKQILDS